jgi:sugar-phosphatase
MTALPARDYAAFLFDMDGTILTSIIAAERVWAAWARSHGLDVDVFLPTIHGKRSVDTVRGLGLPDIDAEAEAHRITLAEIEDVDGIEAIAGVAAFLATLPAERWAIVTSAPRALAQARIAAAGLPLPPVLVAAEDVKHGKPAPDHAPGRMPGVRRHTGRPAIGGRRRHGQRDGHRDAQASGRNRRDGRAGLR